MIIIGQLLLFALNIYMWLIIIDVAISWLVAFEVINPSSSQAQNLMAFFKKITDPVYTPLRKFIPEVGGIDIVPVVVIFAIYVVKLIVFQLFFGPYPAYGL